jgi:hypothetical protein
MSCASLILHYFIIKLTSLPGNGFETPLYLLQDSKVLTEFSLLASILDCSLGDDELSQRGVEDGILSQQSLSDLLSHIQLEETPGPPCCSNRTMTLPSWIL